MRDKKDIESSSKNPAPCPVRYQLIPQELRDRRQWVLWAWRRRKEKWTKVPYSSSIPGEAKADDPSTWDDLKNVVAYRKRNRGQFDGVGYEFAEDDPYTGIDLDDAIDPETAHLMTAREQLAVATNCPPARSAQTLLPR